MSRRRDHRWQLFTELVGIYGIALVIGLLLVGAYVFGPEVREWLAFMEANR